MSRRLGRGRADGGMAVLEVLVLAPAIFLLIDLAVYAGTVATTRAAARHAADAAAREASAARTGTSAAQETAVANALLGDQHLGSLTCTGAVADASVYQVPLGQHASVTYTVSCHATVVGVTFPGIPHSFDYSTTATSVLDPYRWRGK
jgi:Flp pilus assembly protein TadG